MICGRILLCFSPFSHFPAIIVFLAHTHASYFLAVTFITHLTLSLLLFTVWCSFLGITLIFSFSFSFFFPLCFVFPFLMYVFCCHYSICNSLTFYIKTFYLCAVCVYWHEYIYIYIYIYICMCVWMDIYEFFYIYIPPYLPCFCVTSISFPNEYICVCALGPEVSRWKHVAGCSWNAPSAVWSPVPPCPALPPAAPC